MLAAARSHHLSQDAMMIRMPLKVIIGAFLFIAVAKISGATPPPPVLVVLTPATIQKSGFKFDGVQRENLSHARLTYPSTIKNLYARWVELTLLSSSGDILARTTVPIDETSRTIGYNYDHTKVNLSLVVSYCEMDGAACKNYALPSVSEFYRTSDSDREMRNKDRLK